MIECRGETDERRAIKQDLREERERERGIMDHDKRPPPRTRARAGAEAGIYARARDMVLRNFLCIFDASRAHVSGGGGIMHRLPDVRASAAGQ